MDEVMKSVFLAEYEVDNSLGADESRVDIAAFLRQRFPEAGRETVCEVAADLASQGSYVERNMARQHSYLEEDQIWPYIQGGC